MPGGMVTLPTATRSPPSSSSRATLPLGAVGLGDQAGGRGRELQLELIAAAGGPARRIRRGSELEDSTLPVLAPNWASIWRFIVAVQAVWHEADGPAVPPDSSMSCRVRKPMAVRACRRFASPSPAGRRRRRCRRRPRRPSATAARAGRGPAAADRPRQGHGQALAVDADDLVAVLADQDAPAVELLLHPPVVIGDQDLPDPGRWG